MVFTLLRRVKVPQSGIFLEKSFENISIEVEDLKKFCDFFHFSPNSYLCYLYTLAQRAQTLLMLDSSFSMAIPGMVHIENELIETSSFQVNQSFRIDVNVKVAHKEEGSLIPIFEVQFLQNDELKVICRSTYLVRRKSNSKAKKSEHSTNMVDENNQSSVYISQNWVYENGLGRKYAAISGDYNPIHTSGLLAKLFGFKKMIIQGWYSVSKAVAQVENLTEKKVSQIKVSFKQPIFLPNKQVFELNILTNNELQFRIKDQKSLKIKALLTLND